eukprot:TRINITY_DN7515_c0_g1_i2.p1 TRINITY_DN7515_c0_g1~~TRINITY_DN7515_c0_g1_i2.p1  ORF type:complete len:148 (-),score=14.29 TRINITY_DN7515_c0_g1_i2:49-492(-)
MKSIKLILDEYGTTRNINSCKKWGQTGTKLVREMKLVNKGHTSMYSALSSLYPQLVWKAHWFAKLSNGYWNNESNRRMFLNTIAMKYGFKRYTDWYTLTKDSIVDSGGEALLRLYDKSPSKFVISMYPGMVESSIHNSMEHGRINCL